MWNNTRRRGLLWGARRRYPYSYIGSRGPKRRRTGARQFVPHGKQLMEKKDHISAYAEQNLFNNSAVQSLVRTATGTTSITRIGNEITITSINIYIEVYATTPSATGVLKNTGRLFLVYDKQPNGVMATFANINDSATTPFGFRNLNNRMRFKTLWDSGLFSISDNTGNKDYHHCWSVFMNTSLPVGYSTSGSNMTDIQTGNLMLFNQVDTPSTSLFKVQGRIRLRFTDGKQVGSDQLKTWGRNIIKTNI